MAINLDVTSVLKLVAEDEDPKLIERFARRIVDKYPRKAEVLVKKLSLEKQFTESYITVTSANELTRRQKDLIERVLERKTKREPEVTYLINEDLLGGIIIRMGEEVIDNSLRNRVKELTEYIKQTKMGAGV